jgi:Zn-dependent protease with chaperone function
MRTPRRSGGVVIAIAFLLTMGSVGFAQKDGIVIPSYVEKHDLCTRADLRYSRLLDRSLGDPATPEKWLLFRQIKKEMCSVVAAALDAPTIAETVTTALSIEGQEAAKPIQDLVADCARILHVDPPRVWIKQSPFVSAYVTLREEPAFLVIHSGLLELYEGRPQELRFVVGHELGHLKCDHLRALYVGRAIQKAIRKIDELTIPEAYQRILPPISLGCLLSWCREAEMSADRAGLLCCQDIDAAQQALMRALHGLKFDSPWLDPQHKDFDPESRG